METEYSKILWLFIVYVFWILLLFSFSTQNCTMADLGNGFLEADRCQFWSLIQTYMLAQEQESASTSCREYFQE